MAPLFSTAQTSSPDLYVWARSGLKLRQAPEWTAESLWIIPFGAKVQPQSESVRHIVSIPTILGTCPAGKNRDKISLDLKGRWQKVNYAGKSGYVFSPYLINRRPPSKPFDSLEAFMAYWNESAPEKPAPNSLSILFKAVNQSITEETNQIGVQENHCVIQLPEFTPAQVVVWADALFQIEQSSYTQSGSICETRSRHFFFSTSSILIGEIYLGADNQYLALDWKKTIP